MKYYLKLGFVLFVIAAVASGILAYIDSFTKPIIDANKLKAEEEARMEVLTGAVQFEEVPGDFTYYVAKDAEGNMIGYTFKASLYGYSSDVQSMVGVNNDFTINKIKVISQAETPGLGANCIKPEFQAQFSGKAKDVMMVDKDGGQIVSLTGATITTRAIANSIKQGLEKLEAVVSGTCQEVVDPQTEVATAEEVTE